MSIPVTCTCGKNFSAPLHLAGKQTKCPYCGLPLNIGKSETPQSQIVVVCQCGQRLSAEPFLAGQQIPCPVCNRQITIPLPGSSQEHQSINLATIGDLQKWEESMPLMKNFSRRPRWWSTDILGIPLYMLVGGVLFIVVLLLVAMMVTSLLKSTESPRHVPVGVDDGKGDNLVWKKRLAGGTIPVFAELYSSRLN